MLECILRSSKRKLTTDRITELDAIGFDWKGKRTIVKTAAIECSHAPLVPAWPSLSQEPVYYFRGAIERILEQQQIKITSDKIAALDFIGFDWQSGIILFQICRRERILQQFNVWSNLL